MTQKKREHSHFVQVRCHIWQFYVLECHFCARCGPCRFHKNCSYLLASVAGPAALLLSCALVVARTHSCPGTKVRWSWEVAHVKTYFSYQILTHSILYAWYLAQFFQPSKNKTPWLLLSACQARLSAPATSYCTHGFAAACKFCARSCNPYMPQAFPRTCGGIACGGQLQHLPRWVSCHRRACQWALQPSSRQYHYIDEWDFPFHSLWRQIILSCGFHLFYLNGIIWAAVVTFLHIFGKSYAWWSHLKGFNDVTLFIFNRPENILPSSFYYLNICMQVYCRADTSWEVSALILYIKKVLADSNKS